MVIEGKPDRSPDPELCSREVNAKVKSAAVIGVIVRARKDQLLNPRGPWSRI